MPIAEFEPLPQDLEPTLSTMHAYARAIGALSRTHANPHPLWWHAALSLSPTGLSTATMAVPGGGFACAVLDLRNDEVALETAAGTRRTWSMRDAMTGTEMAANVIAAAGSLGLEGEYDVTKFSDDAVREYDPDVASDYLGAVLAVSDVFERHRNSILGTVSPIHVWPHGFDLAFDWVGTRVETIEEDGETSQHPATLNLGFYPWGKAYFYSNPWPFHDELASRQLPSGSRWHLEGWRGSILPYEDVVGRPDGAEAVLAYARAVFEAASPTLA